MTCIQSKEQMRDLTSLLDVDVWLEFENGDVDTAHTIWLCTDSCVHTWILT